jgi:hypothetical protein
MVEVNLNCLDPYDEDERQTSQFEWVKDQQYEGKMIVVDNHLYEKCKFVNCNFVYAGGPFAFRDCQLTGGCLSPTGAARKVLEFERVFQENLRNTPIPPF